jgi:hypothetical protein
MVKFIEASSEKLVFNQDGTVYHFYANGTYRCDNAYYEHGELSNWHIEKGQLYYNHPKSDQATMRWDWKLGSDHKDCRAAAELVEHWFGGEGLLLGFGGEDGI